MASRARADEVERLLSAARDWAAARADVVALALVGSWARGAAREGSDVDLVVLSDDPATYTRGDDWIASLAPSATLVRSGDWGAIREQRLRLASGLELEVGVGRPSWACVCPLDAGTRRVVRDGLRVLYDPRGLLSALVAAAVP